MHQLTQQLKSGTMEILEVPFPVLQKRHVLVRNHFSVISTGTEGKTVTDARKGYLAKALSRQKEVKQVIEMIKSNGLIPTYKMVMNKLEAPSPLGYSTAGEVIEVAEDVNDFKVGDLVACGGAPHADIVSVPVNLCVKIPQEIPLDQAAFSTLAAIAIQGIRQANLKMGENCLIVGMGLLGQLTYKILEASGIHPIGIDISEEQIALSKQAGVSHVFNRNNDDIEDTIMHFTHGYGTDAVIITAATSSNDPVEFAGVITRHKAKVVIVGAVPTGFSRKNYYQKELELLMSCSYGPGRYDANYEEKGIDYPIGYVRWTEKRNMQSYIDLLSAKRLDISSLITHTFSLPEAPKAYDMILQKNESYIGILIRYSEEETLKRKIDLAPVSVEANYPNVAFIGAGSFAQASLLPNMKGLCTFIGITTKSGTTARHIANKFNFSFCTPDSEEIFKNDVINTVFITTRHNLHAENVIQAIKNNKHVFVEKPLALNLEELEEIRLEYEKALENSTAKHVMVGFNRRFSPAVKKVMSFFEKDQPKSIQIRVNAGALPVDHWVNDIHVGGGRVVGEVCHFIDLAMFLSGSKIVSVYANAMSDPHKLNNTVSINLEMENKSIASVNYYSNGNKFVPKEEVEIFCGGNIAQIHDFKTLMYFSKNKKKYKFRGQDKGHSTEVKEFLKSVRDGTKCPISFEEAYISSLATFKVLESLAQGRKIIL